MQALVQNARLWHSQSLMSQIWDFHKELWSFIKLQNEHKVPNPYKSVERIPTVGDKKFLSMNHSFCQPIKIPWVLSPQISKVDNTSTIQMNNLCYLCLKIWLIGN